MNSRKLAIPSFVFVPLILVSFVTAQNKTPEHKAAAPAGHASEARLPLHEGWSLQTSTKVEAKGEVLSTPAFTPKGWHEVTVPTTVVAALVKDKTLPDPYFAMNLRSFAGVNYPI